MTKHIKPEYELLLRELYPTETPISDIASKMGTSETTAQIYARRLGLSRPKVKPWNSLSVEEEALILENYEYGDLNALSQKLNKNIHAIQEWARRNGLKRKIDIKRKGDLSILLNESIQSFYWLGMLAADGYVSNNGHLMFSQGEKDRQSVYDFASYVGGLVNEFEVSTGYKPEPRKVYRVNIQDAEIGLNLRALWGLQPEDKKTYSSIGFDFIKTREQAMAFFVGFFDGDGYTSPNLCGKLEIHSNWLPFLNKLLKLAGFEYEARINKRGFAIANISALFMKEAKAFILQKNISHNHRKWDNV